MYGLLVPPAKVILAAEIPPLLLLPTFNVFWTNESSNIPIFAATKKSWFPKLSHLVEFDTFGAPLATLPVAEVWFVLFA